MKIPEIKKTLRKFLLSESGGITKKSIITQGVILSLFALSANKVGADEEEEIITPSEGYGEAPLTVLRDTYWDPRDSDLTQEGVTVTFGCKRDCHCNAGEGRDHASADANTDVKLDFPLFKWEGSINCHEYEHGSFGENHCSNHAGCAMKFAIPEASHSNEISLELEDDSLAGTHAHSLSGKTLYISSGIERNPDGTYKGDDGDCHASCS